MAVANIIISWISPEETLIQSNYSCIGDEESREYKRTYEIHVAVEIPDGSKLLFSCGLRIFLIKCRRFQGIQNT